jgi:T5SS/PEP-CTERM-associated repeat protein/autotransporter-associated beta strand protein
MGMACFRLFIQVVAAALVLCWGSAEAAIVTTGNVEPDYAPGLWSTTTSVYIGKTSAGTLTVDQGSDVVTRYTWLGRSAGSTGTATVTGAGSTWSNSDIYIGYLGHGILRIEDGGQVNKNTCYLGHGAGSSGQAIVSGAGSQWTNSDSLYVGGQGSGTLTVSDGGQVSAKSLYASLNDLLGNGTINVTSGGVLDADLVFDSASKNNQTFAFGSGGTLNFTLSGNPDLGVGYKDTGSMLITEGVAIASNRGYLGYYPGSTGSAVVSGAGSKWTTSQYLYVGIDGSGTLTVSDGGVVSTKTLFASLSNLSGNGIITASGGAVLDADLVFDSTHGSSQTLAFGTGGALNLTVDRTGALGAGYKADGSVRIADGVTVTSQFGYLGYRPGSSGAITVCGVGSEWKMSSTLELGRYGNGALRIESGAQVTNDSGYLGNYSGSNGTATVTGTGSRWVNNGGLYVGYSGSGTLTVADGGLVSAKTLYASPSNLLGNGRISVKGAILDTDLVFDSTHGTTQDLPFGTGGVLALAVDGSGDLGAAYQGSASLRIADGIVVSSKNGYIGFSSGSNGVAEVQGAGSTWSNSSSLNAGRNGMGTLNITAGGHVSNTHGYVGYNTNSSGTANVRDAGSKWSNSADLTVGYYGNGTLNVEAGAQVASIAGYLGYESSSTGTAAVSGLGSKWTNSGDLFVGYWGDGTLRVEDGGQVSSTNGSLGHNAGSSGTAVVTGAGSTWTNSGSLYVGRNGSGTLTVADGGQVTARVLYASLSDLLGNGTIAITSGAVLDADLVFAGAQGTSPTLAFGSGGVLNLTVNWTGELGVGYKGNGSLSITDGAVVLSNNGSLGDYAGASGTATITGPGSRWNIGSNLSVGYSGHGQLLVEAGAVVGDTSASLGYCAGSSGVATVSGAGSRWSNNDLYVGRDGSGTLSVTGGAQVSSQRAYVGYGTGATGSVTVSGAGSTWTNIDDLYVGRDGSGTLTVADGGMVSTTMLYAAPSSLLGNGTINVNGGGFFDADLIFDSAHGPTQALGFGTGGALNVTVAATRVLGVGYEGNGSLRIADAKVVSSNGGHLGYGAGANGTATVTGAGSKWTNSYDLYIGTSGSGTLSINGGAQASNSKGYLGYNAGSSGTATVTGASSQWTNSSDLHIGSSGNGTLTIDAGGLVTNAKGYIGFNAGSTGTASVNGMGSKWTNSSALYVGNSGNGTLNIDSGAQVGNTEGYLGYGSGSSGVATVSGATSQWINSSTLYVGYRGSGTLTIDDGGKVTNTWGVLGYNTGSHGTVTVSGAGSTWVNSSSVSVFNGTLTVADGGLVTAKTLSASLTDLLGDGTITVDGGAVLDTDIVFDGTHGSMQTFPFGNGGVLNVAFGTGGLLGVAFKGNGSLRIADGVTVVSGGGRIGDKAGSHGTATVTGVGTKWSHNTLMVGVGGQGALTIESGAQMRSGWGCELGREPGSTGTVTVKGVGSKWTTDGEFYIGNEGTGTLIVEDGGELINSGVPYPNPYDCVYVGRLEGSSGTVTVHGAGSNWISDFTLYVGFRGNGALTVDDGGKASSLTTYVGDDQTSTGAVIVRGAGSQLTSSDLYLGRSGSATLTVVDGGLVAAQTIFASLADLSGNGTIVAKGAVLDADFAIDSTHSTPRTLAFGSGGLLNVAFDGSGALGAGFKGNGSLRVADGVSVTSTDGYVGYSAGSTGTATLTGPGTKWTLSRSLSVGYSGNGSLTIESGAAVSNVTGYIGQEKDSNGLVVATGAGSMWTCRKDLNIGYSGSGTLRVEAGGQVSNNFGRLGSYFVGSRGEAIVSGAGSQWTNKFSLYVGASGNGTLTVSDGGHVSNTTGYIAYSSGKTGAATVSGAGSTWSNASALYVGYSGNGTMRIEAGGQVSNTLGRVGSGSAVTVTGPGSTWTNSDVLQIASLGEGTLTVADGGLVTAKALYASIGSLFGNGTIAVNGALLDADLIFTGDRGPTRTIAFGEGGALTVAVDGSAPLGVGYGGTGTLRIAEGAALASTEGYVGYNAGSHGVAIVSGAGSRWANSSDVVVGNYGGGTLIVENGGAVNGTAFFIGRYGTAQGRVMIDGAGSKCDGKMYIGSAYGNGVLSLTGGGAATGPSAVVDTKGLLAIAIGRGSKLTVNNGTGSFRNDGTVRILAGAGATAGWSYTPIAAGTWYGNGTYQAVGGKWTTSNHWFTVSSVQTGASGTPLTLNLLDQQRIMISDSMTGWSLGESYLSKFGTINVTTTAIDLEQRTNLEQVVAPGQSLLSGWTFATSGAYAVDEPVYLSFDIGAGYARNDLSVWMRNTSSWNRQDLADLTYDGRYASFTATGLNSVGYALAGTLTRHWSGSAGGAWSDGVNWNPSVAFKATDLVTFANPANTTSNNDLMNQQVGGLEFAAGAGAFALTGNALRVAGKINDQAATAQEINLPVEFVAGPQSGTVNVVAGGELTISQPVSGNQGLTKTGEGKLELMQDAAYTGNTVVEAGILELAGLSKSGSTTVSGLLVADYIHQDSLIINAGGTVEIRASGHSATSAADFPSTASSSGSLSWLVNGGGLPHNPDATTPVPEPAAWLLMAIAVSTALSAGRCRK